jgi:hypothetical protein
MLADLTLSGKFVPFIIIINSQLIIHNDHVNNTLHIAKYHKLFEDSNAMWKYFSVQCSLISKQAFLCLRVHRFHPLFFVISVLQRQIYAWSTGAMTLTRGNPTSQIICHPRFYKGHLLTPLPSFICSENRSLISMSNVLSLFWANVGVLNAAFSPFITIIKKTKKMKDQELKIIFVQWHDYWLYGLCMQWNKWSSICVYLSRRIRVAVLRQLASQPQSWMRKCHWIFIPHIHFV